MWRVISLFSYLHPLFSVLHKIICNSKIALNPFWKESGNYR